MRKMYFLTVLIIAFIAFSFIYFSTNEEIYAKKFLKAFGIVTEQHPTSRESILIPENFDKIFEEYNDLQKSAGFDLAPYRGKAAVKFTFRVLNFPDPELEIFANVIIIDEEVVAADLISPRLSGFILPVNYLKSAPLSSK